MSGLIPLPHESTASLESDGVVQSPRAVGRRVSDRRQELVAAGIRAGDNVVVHRPATCDYVYDIVALVGLGCCVAPLSPHTSALAVEAGASDVGARAIIDSRGTVNLLAPPSSSGEYRSGGAYILFTSGSSGAPKGVCGTVEGLRSRLDWADATFFGAGPRRCALTGDPAFIDSLTTLLGAYRTGQHLVLAPESILADLGRLPEFIHSAAIEQLTLVPSIITAFDDAPREYFGSIRRWIFSGEELRAAHAARIRELTPRAEILNSYGSTEVCGDVLTFRLAAEEPIPAPIPIGSPVPGIRTALRQRAPQDFGTPCDPDTGELIVSGAQVASGYTGNAEADGKCFRTGDDGERWFATGDLVRRTDKGFEFLGRLDQLVKVRGRRIDPGAVAEALESVPGVRAAHVYVHSRRATTALVADVVLERDSTMTAEHVLASVRDRAVSHHVPDRINLVDSLARGRTGKVTSGRGAKAVTDPANPSAPAFASWTEREIARLLSEFVGFPDVTAESGFSTAGLDSLSTVAFANRAGRLLGCRITALDVAAAGTVAGLAAAIPRLQSGAPLHGTREVMSGDGRTALIVLHPAIGTCLGLLPLVRALDYPGTVVFVEQDDEARAVVAGGSAAELGEHYARQVAELCPSADYDVIGYSFGALLAPMVVSALQRRGRNLRTTILVDPYVAVASPAPTVDWALRRILGDGGHRYALPPATLDPRSAYEVIQSADGPLRAVPEQQLATWAESLRDNAKLSQSMQPSIPGTPTLVLASRDSDPSLFADSPEDRARHVVRRDVDCSHFDLLAPELAAELALAIIDFRAELHSINGGEP